MIKDYNPTGVKETDFEDSHGNKGYNVFFEGEDKPVFMMAKRAPEVGNVEYGEIVDTPKRSGEGTYRKFVRKQKEEGATPELGKTYAVSAEGVSEVSINGDSRQDSIVRQSALKSAVAAVGKPESKEILSMADQFLVWLRNEDTPAKTVDDKPEEKEPLPEFQGEDDIDLDAIPF